MSAICGVLYFNGRHVTQETSANMMREFEIYHADAVGTCQKEQIFLACHAQHITPESAQEILPYHDVLSGLIITADAIVDNRAELIHKLGIEHSFRKGMPDSKLILLAYLKWGHECPKHLVGDFSFAIWDERKQELFCAVDHTGTRTFYYFRSSTLFAFSTLIKPLFSLKEIPRKHNELWLADFLAMPCQNHQLDPELTPYQNIRLLPAGHSLIVNPSRSTKKIYWQVEKQQELKLKSNYEYEEAFREVLDEAVKCRLRSIRPIGVMLSGGLDSTSIACLAARELGLKGQRLQAFSAVPMASYRDWLPACIVADETPFIEAVREHAGNIDVTYCSSEGKHSLSDTDRLLASLEQPYKIFENLFWIESIFTEAQGRNVGVLLNGAAGNVTISWGRFEPYMITLLRTGQLYRLIRECWLVAKRFKRPHRVLLKMLWTLLPYNIKNMLSKFSYHKSQRELQALSLINPVFASQSSVDKRFHQFGYDKLFDKSTDSLEERKIDLILPYSVMLVSFLPNSH
ncbi:hypothetical protein N752_07185 [Desulforamulus aquiferis]|nr:asparagine synthase-related protein [Desulforamulus aquiferis]RYD05672.1 hypothetical protein N752_07185 [Desulforamulus aquiferis]